MYCIYGVGVASLCTLYLNTILFDTQPMGVTLKN